jgi:hypothetical protein
VEAEKRAEEVRGCPVLEALKAEPGGFTDDNYQFTERTEGHAKHHGEASTKPRL